MRFLYLPGTRVACFFKDTAAVVAAALGLPIPESWDARVPAALFRG
ncbi:hypothetical protein ABEX25_15810 [Paenibacillus thiaminolyticus]